MPMNEEIARIYNTNDINESESEDLQKQASLELFAKLASKHGVDLASMEDHEVQALYEQTMGEKLASDDEDDEKKKEEKKDKKLPPFMKKDDDEKDEEGDKEAAAQYFQEKRAQHEKLAEADMMGRVMAHAFVQERESIESEKIAAIAEAEGWDEDQIKEAKHYGATLIGMGRKAAGPSASGKAKAVGERVKDYAGRAAGAARKGEQSASEAVGKRVGGAVSGGGKQVRMSPSDARKVGRGAAAAGLAAGAGGVAAASGKKKESSAEQFERISAEEAIKMAAANGYDADEAYNRVNAVFTLGFGESEKIAHVQDPDDAIQVRGLEYLEQAGYPVNWEEVFGSE